MENKIELSGCELVALAGSLAIAISKKLCDKDIKKVKFVINLICANLSVIESEGRERKGGELHNFTQKTGNDGADNRANKCNRDGV